MNCLINMMRIIMMMMRMIVMNDDLNGDDDNLVWWEWWHGVGISLPVYTTFADRLRKWEFCWKPVNLQIAGDDFGAHDDEDHYQWLKIIRPKNWRSQRKITDQMEESRSNFERRRKIWSHENSPPWCSPSHQLQFPPQDNHHRFVNVVFVRLDWCDSGDWGYWWPW